MYLRFKRALKHFLKNSILPHVLELFDEYKDKLHNVVIFSVRSLTSNSRSARAWYLCEHPRRTYQRSVLKT